MRYSALAALRPDFLAAPEWVMPAAVFGVVLVCLLSWSWTRTRTRSWVSTLGLCLKALAVALVLALLLEPMSREESIEPQANVVVVLADNSRSMDITASGSSQTAIEQLKRSLEPGSSWLAELGRTFDVRQFSFDRQLQQLDEPAQLDATGHRSNLYTALDQVQQRFADRPVAGVIVLTDGIATDQSNPGNGETNVEAHPVFPVVIGQPTTKPDVRVTRIAASETNFEAAPVTVSADIAASKLNGKKLIARLTNSEGKTVDEQKLEVTADDEPISVRFQVQPDSSDLEFYKVTAFVDGADPANITDEATALNNARTVMVDRSGGPYRVLYVCGRPNWEFKFLKRSLATDDEIDLVGLIRIAKREPKFTFRDDSDGANPLFRGFGADEETAEQYDEPVLLRVGTEDAEELRAGFPSTAEELFRYHAVIIDDLESEFFTQDQKALLQDFVSQRGGGLLMLGGQETFQGGEYARTPIGEMLPVYADRSFNEPSPIGYRLALTRDGWLETWTRLRSTEQAERERLQALPEFVTVNRLSSIKPGARVLADVETADGKTLPALVTQPFGRGRTAALLIGDLWKWHLRRDDVESDDFGKAWRQTMRWLVAEVPQRIDATLLPPAAGSEAVQFEITLRDEQYRLLDNASIEATITKPDGESVELHARPIEDTSGAYRVSFLPRDPGVYHASFQGTAADGSEIGVATSGVVHAPVAEELRQLSVDRDVLDQIAADSGGQVVPIGELSQLVDQIKAQENLVKKTAISPVWHTWTVLAAIMLLLVAEWGLRRWKGLP